MFKADYSNALDERSRLLLVREVLTVDLYSQPKGSRERARLWEEIVSNLSAVSEPCFSVSLRSVRDGVNTKETKESRRKQGQWNSS